jgi:hypothetical protein
MYYAVSQPDLICPSLDQSVSQSVGYSHLFSEVLRLVCEGEMLFILKDKTLHDLWFCRSTLLVLNRIISCVSIQHMLFPRLPAYNSQQM